MSSHFCWEVSPAKSPAWCQLASYGYIELADSSGHFATGRRTMRALDTILMYLLCKLIKNFQHTPDLELYKSFILFVKLEKTENKYS